MADDLRVRAKVKPGEVEIQLNVDNNKRGRNLELPPDHISELILRKLTPFSTDYSRFGAVCKQWFSIFMEDFKQRRCRAQQNQHIPFLLVPTQITQTNTLMVSCRLYSVTDTKFMDSLNLRVIYNADDEIVKYCGSSYGWLSFVLKSYEIVLYNPFVSKSIRLPAIKNTRAYAGFTRYDYRNGIPDSWLSGVHKVVLSADPRTTDDYVVVAIYGRFRRLAFFRSKSSCSLNDINDTEAFDVPSWRYLEEGKGYKSTGFEDVIFHQGLVYAIIPLLIVSHLYCLDTSSSNGDYPVIKSMINAPKPLVEYGASWYLAETSTKELLFIARLLLLWLNGDHSTENFRVYKLKKLQDHNNKELQQWVEIKSLEGDAVFIGASHSMSIVASDSPGCQPDSIYFTDDCHCNDNLSSVSFWHNDVGIFNLKDGSKSKHYSPDPAHKRLPLPVWILPMF